MDKRMHIGIDCSDEALTGAILIGQPSLQIFTVSPGALPAYIIDPIGSASRIGVSFPSLLSRIDSDLKVQDLASEHKLLSIRQVMEMELSHIRHQALLRANCPIGGTVFTVPVLLSQSLRQVLRDSAISLNLQPVTLLDRGIGAVIGHLGNQDSPVTALVYDLGYSNFEYTLVRLARGRHHVLDAGTVGSAVSHDAAPRAACQYFVDLVIEQIIRSLQDRSIFLGLTRWDLQQWGDIRQIAKRALMTLMSLEPAVVVLKPELTALAEVLQVELTVDWFRGVATPYLQDTFAAIENGLEANQLQPSDIDIVLVVSEAAQTAIVGEMLSERLSTPFLHIDASTIAAGAALFSHQQAALPVAATGVGTPHSSSDRSQSDATGRAVIDTTSPTTGEAQTESKTNRVTGKERLFSSAAASDTEILTSWIQLNEAMILYGRGLLKEGRLDEAKRVGTILLENIHPLLAEVQQLMQGNAPSSSTLTQAESRLREAREQLRVKNTGMAVRLAHEAYKSAPNDAAVFSEMMDIHIQASEILDCPEDFDLAISILQCAHRHDQTDKRVHSVLAERFYHQAAVLKGLNNASNSLKLAELALKYAPRHSKARELANFLRGSQEDEPAKMDAAPADTTPDPSPNASVTGPEANTATRNDTGT